MPRTPIPVTDIPYSNGVAVTWTAADSANNHSFPNDGQTLLLVRNTDAATKTVTVVSVPDDGGRLGDITLTAPATAGVCTTNLVPIKGYNQTDGTVNVNVAVATGVTLACVRIVPRR